MNENPIRIALLGAIIGLMAGSLVMLFRLAIEFSQALFLPGGEVGNYEALPAWLRFALPVAGALVLGLAFEKLPAGTRTVGIVHVLDSLRFRRQRLPLSNALVQFFGGLVAIVSGQSVDREGPGVHLGAVNASLLGRRIDLTHDEGYLLAGAGAAAGIAAAYNTPLAGVIFVIEVLRIRYAVFHIVPVIVAAATGAVIGQLVYGEHTQFNLGELSIGSLAELPIMILMGVIVGLIASAFIAFTRLAARTTIDWRPLPLFLCAGVVTGLLAQSAPQIMGLSYDAINRIFSDQLGITALLLILLAKFIATAIATGFRLPGGVIGPSLLLGATVGGIMEWLVQDSYPFYQESIGFYAIVGMVAMMGAILRAPLAALVALIELTGNLNIILPGLIAVVIAEIITRTLMGDQSIFTMLVRVKHSREALQQAQDTDTNESRVMDRD